MLTATNNSFLIADRQKKEGNFFKIMGLTDKLSNEVQTKPILLLTVNVCVVQPCTYFQITD